MNKFSADTYLNLWSCHIYKGAIQEKIAFLSQIPDTMSCLKIFAILLFIGSILNEAFSHPQVAFAGNSNEDTEEDKNESVETRSDQDSDNPTQGRTGLLSDVLGKP